MLRGEHVKAVTGYLFVGKDQNGFALDHWVSQHLTKYGRHLRLKHKESGAEFTREDQCESETHLLQSLGSSGIHHKHQTMDLKITT
jgi:hypothetical protein